MDLLQLRYFQVVARVEHVTKAAEELSIAQPSLSKTIRRLEKEIGAPLFERQGRAIRLNQFGRAFLRHVEALFYELEEGQRQVRDMAGLEHGEISLVAASLHWLPELLHSFQLLHPSVHFHLSQRLPAEMPQQLETGACDFCFLSTPLIKSGFKWKTLLNEEILLVVPVDHRLAGQKSIPLREIADEPVVIEKVGGDLRGLLDAFYQQADLSPCIAYETNEPTVLIEFVKAHLGVTFSPAFGKKRIEEQGLCSLRITNPTCQRTFGMAWHQEHYLSQAAHTFRQFIVEYFAHLETPPA
ncbi:MAG: LysR family transcriptional regulator [Ktedonobacteraceae bacterium]|nr:LysR family transcriptional regulator [Ktedonobacteraceae bacterium]